MIPKRHKYEGFSTIQPKNKPYAARQFVEINTHKNISLRSDFMYLEDAKTAINISTLEERIKLKRWLIRQLQKSTSQDILIQSLFNSSDKDRHKLQKCFRITL